MISITPLRGYSDRVARDLAEEDDDYYYNGDRDDDFERDDSAAEAEYFSDK